MNIHDLCEKSGVSRQTIYRYTQMGLLPKPVKIGFKESHFDESHLQTLVRIRDLREKDRMPFKDIQELLLTETPEQSALETNAVVKKEQFLDKGIELFSKYGFAETKVSDITDALGVAKGTFYLYFKSKRDLFLDCISRVTMLIIPPEVWQEVGREPDFFARLRIKLLAFLKAFPKFSGILTLLKFSLQSDDPVIADKARHVYNVLGRHLMRDMNKALRNKEIRVVNVEIMGLLLQGMAEALGFIPSMDARFTYEEGAEIFLEFVKKGLVPSEPVPSAPGGESWNVSDSEGLILRLRNIGFNGSNGFSGTFGEGEIRVDMAGVIGIRMEKPGVAVVTTGGGDEIRLNVDDGLFLSGQSPFGEYRAPLSKISSIVAAPAG